MRQFLQKTIVYTLIASLLSMASPALVQAEIIGTLSAIEASQCDANLAKINDVLAREEVREKMRAYGVNEAQVEARLASLTDQELSTLAQEMENMPAAGGALEVVGIVFIVLLILEAVGVIDIFKKFP